MAARISSIVKEGVHFKRHSYNRECPSCKKSFDSPIGFKTHWTCYKKSGVYKKMEDGSESWGCTECPKKFPKYGHLNLHVARQHAEKNLECLKCHQMFASQSAVFTHKCYNHLRVDQSIPRAINSKKYVEGVHYKRHPFLKKCKDCWQSFADPVDFISHDKCTKPRLCVRKNDETGKYQCEWPGCEVELKGLENRKKHFSRHAEKIFECLVCHEMSGCFNVFGDHFKNYHKSVVTPNKKKTSFEKCVSLGREILALDL